MSGWGFVANFFRSFATLSTVKLLALCVVLDILAMGLHFLHVEGVINSRFFNFSRDRGFCEIVQYFKEGLVIFLFISWNRLKPCRLLRAWAILFSCILLDDALQFHELIGRLGKWLIDGPLVLGFHKKEFFELLGFIIIEGTALAYVGWCSIRSSRPQFFISCLIGAALMPLIFSGVILDRLPFYNLEQLGEMVSMSIVLGVVHSLIPRESLNRS